MADSKLSALTEKTAPAATNLLYLDDGGDKKVKVSTLVGAGWIGDPNTWTYSSADAPTFVASVNADVTGILSEGMRIKLTQTTAKYFIVTAVAAFSGGATLITLYGGTDYVLANAAITAPAYSSAYAPLGFPRSLEAIESAIVLIAETILSIDTASIAFTNIPPVYRHLRLIVRARSGFAGYFDELILRLNGDTGLNYDAQYAGVLDDGSTVSAGASSGNGQARFAFMPAASASDATRFATVDGTLYYYSRTDLPRMGIFTNAYSDALDSGNGLMQTFAHWNNTADVVTNLQISSTNMANLKAGTIATLYGIR